MNDRNEFISNVIRLIIYRYTNSYTYRILLSTSRFKKEIASEWKKFDQENDFKEVIVHD